jgi:glycosyltransferase involved in cell wall biosynthesis
VRDLFRLVLHWPQVRLICNSAMGARSFETWLGMEAGSANVVMNGYDFDLIDRQAGTRSPVTLRSELGWTSSHVVVGLAARIHPVKRWHVWLRVLKTVSDRNPQVRGLCVGDGPLMDEMKALARDLDLEGKVQFVGRKVPVEPWIGAMDILMMTSESEGLPNTLIEAQALGVPVISNDAGGAAETILEGETGHLVRCNHLPEHEIAERLAEPLDRLASDHALRRHMAGQARSFARSRFSIAQAAKVYLAYYASVGAAGKALPPSDP